MIEQGAKYDTGKPDYSLLPSDSLVDLVRVYEHGVRKYGRNNWRKGLLYSRIFAAIMRHLWAWWKGSERNDEDEGLRHLAQAAWGCITLLEYTRIEGQYSKFDDRDSTVVRHFVSSSLGTPVKFEYMGVDRAPEES